MKQKIQKIAYLFHCLILLFFIQEGYCSTSLLTIADIHYGMQTSMIGRHDTDQQLLKIAMTKFSQLAEKVDFILFLGDLPAHGKYPLQRKEAYEKIVFQSLYKADTQAKPLFYIPGNNDSLAGNYQPFAENNRSPLDLAENWTGACAYCEHLIINKEHMYDGGYYSSYAIPSNPDLILIALNTTQFMSLPLPYPQYKDQEKDASKQLEWFAQQLAQHQAKQLLIAMHEPPGFNYYRGGPYWQPAYLEQFLESIKNNRGNYKQITLLTAHSHMDEIRIINLNQKTKIYAFSTPSISPIHLNNPAMKRFTFDDSLRLKNFSTYYTRTAKHWSLEHYDAISKINGIFPQCEGLHLKACLNSLNKIDICKQIEAGLFYGVKSLRVNNRACQKVLEVNRV
jgi:alkaline phosphatase D